MNNNNTAQQVEKEKEYIMDLKKFDMNIVRDHNVIVIIGRRETGKSYVARSIMYNKQDIPIGMIISPTEQFNEFFSEFVPKMLIHYEYTSKLVVDFLKRQAKQIKRINHYEGKSGMKSDIDPRAFLIFDDCLADAQTWVKEKSTKTVFMNGRHYKFIFILTLQDPLGIPPKLRTNVDFTFIMREPYLSNRRRIYEAYAGVFPTFEIFCKVMDECTENFGCLVIHNNSKKNRIEDQVFWYRADPELSFKLCPEQLWDLSKQVCPDTDDEDLTSEEEITEIPLYQYQKKSAIRLHVNKQDN